MGTPLDTMRADHADHQQLLSFLMDATWTTSWTATKAALLSSTANTIHRHLRAEERSLFDVMLRRSSGRLVARTLLLERRRLAPLLARLSLIGGGGAQLRALARELSECLGPHEAETERLLFTAAEQLLDQDELQLAVARYAQEREPRASTRTVAARMMTARMMTARMTTAGSASTRSVHRHEHLGQPVEVDRLLDEGAHPQRLRLASSRLVCVSSDENDGGGPSSAA